MDISCIVTLHDEGFVAYQALRSVAMSIAALEGAARCEILVSLDDAGSETYGAVEDFDHADLKVLEFQYRELASARNACVEQASGDYVAFLDGDDMWSENWLRKALDAAQKSAKSNTVFHPQFNLYFGRTKQHVFEHIDSESDTFTIDYARHVNCWTALSFAKREIYCKYPFMKNDIQSGFGYEDWTWNVELLESGCRHAVVEDTIHFIRQDDFGDSLSERTRRNRAVPRVRALYTSEIARR